jgi:transposase-like protein
MKCPACNSENVHARGKRYALYPSGIVAIIGWPLAMLHQMSVPFDYHCNVCDREFSHRTKLARVARAVLVLLVWVLAMVCVLGIVAVIIAR